MAIELKKLEKKDYAKAIQYASDGMHFQVYFEDDPKGLYFYERYFFYSEILKSTSLIAAYENNQFIGLLIARMNGQKRCYYSLIKLFYVKMFEWIQHIFFQTSAGQYEMACQDMLKSYQQVHHTDGEIVFLAVDPSKSHQGIGTMLLNAFERTIPQKTIYLYTDNQCSYQFYDHRGFHRVQERDIVLKLRKEIPLKCMLYVKEVGHIS